MIILSYHRNCFFSELLYINPNKEIICQNFGKQRFFSLFERQMNFQDEFSGWKFIVLIVPKSQQRPKLT